MTQLALPVGPPRLVLPTVKVLDVVDTPSTTNRRIPVNVALLLLLEQLHRHAFL